MPSLRTLEGKKKFQDYKKSIISSDRCVLCDKPVLKGFKYWQIVKNDFPYDQVAEIHHMFVPIRHVVVDGLNEAELGEMRTIREGYINDNYDYMIEATHKNKSVPDHFHLHLILAKPEF